MTRSQAFETARSSRMMILCVLTPFNRTSDPQAYFEEFKSLVRSNGIEYETELFMKLRTVSSSHFLTPGKIDDVARVCREHEIEELIISEPLSAQQERNLSEVLRVRVFDRTQLILEIFEKGAHSAEGKTQVAIAMLEHKRSRVSGKGIHLSQQAGRIGTKGPGETQKEIELQHIDHLLLKLNRDLKHLQRIRATQRKRRLESRLPLISLVGYTNAGKSTILNLLTKSDVLAEDRLFATLDTTTRELFVHKRKIGLLSDTVGFIQQLPPQLIDAFKSTLAELEYADLLLHVVDVSDKNWPDHVRVVHEILDELGLYKPMVHVFNKVDRLSEEERAALDLDKYAPYVLVSALSKDGITQLNDYLDAWHTDTYGHLPERSEDFELADYIQEEQE